MKYEDLIIQNNKGWTPLHFACYYGHLEIVKELLSRLGDYDLIIQNHYGKRLLYYACWSAEKEIIKLLILNGSPIIIFHIYNAYMKSIKWAKHEHKNVMHIQTRNNMQMVFMIYGIDMLQKV